MKRMRQRVLCALACVACAGAGLDAQAPHPVSEIELRTEPSDARVRPYASIPVRVIAYGRASEEATETGRLRLNRGPASFHLRDPGAGWLSKPYRYPQGSAAPRESEPGERHESRLLDLSERQSVLKDAVLFTASGREGAAVVTAALEGVVASIRIRVNNDAPASAPAERVQFGPEPASADPYRPLAERYAPFIAQETWFQPKSDYLARFDMDGDWRGDNNWDNAPTGSSQAYVYYAAMETETHWFLVYSFFHPRDYSDKCAVGTCHENDNEGLVVTVAKDGSQLGRLIAVETLAHNKIYSYRAVPGVRRGFHDLEGDIEVVGGTHPVVFVQSGGHGVYGLGRHAAYSLAEDRFLAGTGVTYVYKGVAERPRHPSDREVGYELLPVFDHWWLPAHETPGPGGTAFTSYFRYEPFGGRPAAAYPLIAGAFRGVRHGADVAKPFWGWHDHETREKGVLSTGQWALDPAYSVSRSLALPGPFSLRYTFNPYLQAPE